MVSDKIFNLSSVIFIKVTAHVLHRHRNWEGGETTLNHFLAVCHGNIAWGQ